MLDIENQTREQMVKYFSALCMKTHILYSIGENTYFVFHWRSEGVAAYAWDLAHGYSELVLNVLVYFSILVNVWPYMNMYTIW
jgi:hypothetical protein